MKVLVTGSDGFIAKNLCIHLNDVNNFELVKFNKNTSLDELPHLVSDVDIVIHLAGVNRPDSIDEFALGNVNLTVKLCQALQDTGRAVPVVFSSSTQAVLDNPYGITKSDAEKQLWNYAEVTGSDVYIYRLPNVFGKWCKPNYNSVVATFCHNLSRDLPISVNDPNAAISLVYIDDVISEFMRIILDRPITVTGELCHVDKEYSVTVGAIADAIATFKASRDTLISEQVGTGFLRALYSTYVSYLPTNSFAYSISKHSDERGDFVEMLKTQNTGQFSYFTAHTGVTRGGHYHHTKTEKFLVIRGTARFGFRHILTDETYEIFTSGEHPQVVETVPGWSHDVTNIGSDEMIVMLWANEIFDRDNPDTFSHQV